MKSTAVALAALFGVSVGNAPPSGTVNEAYAVRGVLPSVVSINIVNPRHAGICGMERCRTGISMVRASSLTHPDWS